jgi:cytidylate kinase
MSFQIAIDGPVAAGKGTVARLVAARLGSLYVDTGAMYRATALLAKRKGISLEDEAVVAEAVRQSEITLRTPKGDEADGRLCTVLLDGEDVSWAIRTEEISMNTSAVAKLASVRKELVAQQQRIANTNDVVMEGRDITSVVLPKAQLKIYLDASIETRAKRRFQELQTRGVSTTYEKVYGDIEQRDKADSERPVDPLKIVEGAWVLDTSNLTIEEVVDIILQKVASLKKELK